MKQCLSDVHSLMGVGPEAIEPDSTQDNTQESPQKVAQQITHANLNLVFDYCHLL